MGVDRLQKVRRRERGDKDDGADTSRLGVTGGNGDTVEEEGGR